MLTYLSHERAQLERQVTVEREPAVNYLLIHLIRHQQSLLVRLGADMRTEVEAVLVGKANAAAEVRGGATTRPRLL